MKNPIDKSLDFLKEGTNNIFDTAKKNTQKAVFKVIRPHRYILTLMGFFAIYCGLIYNDYLSISLDLFGSCFDVLVCFVGNSVSRSDLLSEII